MTRTDESWWNLPWTAWLYEDGSWRTLTVAATRKGALKKLERRIAEIDQPKPVIIYEEEVPYNGGVISP